jgi:anti-sigma-K factor RskA
VAETDRDEIEGLAAEYVLGTLDDSERRAAEARYAADPAFRAAVSDWERRLQPLADSAREQPPQAATFDRILARIDAAPPAATGANVVSLRREVRRWRISTGVLGAMAAALAAILVVDRATVPAPQTEFVAVLTAEGAKPAFVATVNIAAGTVSIRQLAEAAVAPADRSFELWSIEPGATPKSLGIIEQASYTAPVAASGAGVTFAITEEQAGGSPDGKPHGPVVFSGELVATE